MSVDANLVIMAWETLVRDAVFQNKRDAINLLDPTKVCLYSDNIVVVLGMVVSVSCTILCVFFLCFTMIA